MKIFPFCRDLIRIRAWMSIVLALGTSLLPGCATKSSTSDVRLNQIQVIGTHNSYHLRGHPSLRSLITRTAPAQVNGLDYEHRPLPEQLSRLGIRQIELDCFADPEGGRFAEPRGPKWAASLGFSPVPNYDPEGQLRRPGFKVMHVQDVDYHSSVLTLVEGLKQVRDWSNQHPGHVPIFILLELKEDAPTPLLTQPLQFGEAELAALEAEILSVFPKEKIIKPDDIRGNESTLPAALKKHGWPRLDSVRGKVFFGMDNQSAVRDLYLKGHPALENRLIFVSVAPTNPAAAWMKENDAISDFDRIRHLVSDGFLVRTRADADTNEARANDTKRREKALASGAQFISTDYPEPNTTFSAYSVRFDGGIVVRVNPVNGNPALQGIELDNAKIKIGSLAK
jgi:hypothetical protein